jgi:putative addiction module component (TIGR02574 family)
MARLTFPKHSTFLANYITLNVRRIELEIAMKSTAESLSAQATQLPPEERMALVERILDSLDEPDASLDALWAKEADDRLAAYRRGEIRAVALSDVIAKYQVTKKPA